jgi:hypothetical protein
MTDDQVTRSIDDLFDMVRGFEIEFAKLADGDPRKAAGKIMFGAMMRATEALRDGELEPHEVLRWINSIPHKST